MKQTRREAFLAEMEAVAPFSLLVSLLEPFYPRVAPQGGRPPYPLEVMLRIHLMQNRSALSDEAMENERIDVACIRRFAGIDLVTKDDSKPSQEPALERGSQDVAIKAASIRRLPTACCLAKCA